MAEMTFHTKNWICPSDRELILRAKLNAGWSVNSNNVFRKYDVLSTSEWHSIEQVLRRARELEILEMDRIGKMIYRLNNMTQNALGDGARTCSLCGLYSSLFRASFIHCFDCSKVVCEKCRIDAQCNCYEMCVLCKICAENREVWKKSGGWFYGRLPSNTLSKNPIDASNSDSPKLGKAYEKWEHRAPEIVRLESFEPPEENSIEHPLYKNWAVNSTPDLNLLEEEENQTSKLPFKLENDDKIECKQLTLPEAYKLSVSCPSLIDDDVKQKKFQSLSKKKLFAPKRRMAIKRNKVHKDA